MRTLHPADISALRECVRRLDRQNADRAWPLFRLVHGPLDGLSLKLDPATNRRAFVGICQLTSVGLIQVLYRRNEPAELRFHSIEWPRGRMTSMPRNPFEPQKISDHREDTV